MHGDHKYGPGYKHFDYVNASAPKGGTVRFSDGGTFDNLNPFILKGLAAAGASQFQYATSLDGRRPHAHQHGYRGETVRV